MNARREQARAEVLRLASEIPNPELRAGIETIVSIWAEEAQALDAALDREAKWIRAFNSLEKPVTDHIERCIDADDLDRAHRAVMREFGPNGGSE